MTQPVTYVELNSPDLEATARFFTSVFGWRPEPFTGPEYLVAGHDSSPGIDTGLLASHDGQPRAIPVIRVNSLDVSMASTRTHGGKVVVEPFEIDGVGRGCYVVDPAGLLIGLHEYA